MTELRLRGKAERGRSMELRGQTRAARFRFAGPAGTWGLETERPRSGGVTEPGLCPSGGPRDRCRAPVEGVPGGLCQGGRPYPDAGPSKLGLPPRVAKGRGRNKAGEASSTPLLPGPPRATYLQDKENSLLFFFSFFFSLLLLP